MRRAPRDTLDGILFWAKNCLFKPHLAKKQPKRQFFGPQCQWVYNSLILLSPRVASYAIHYMVIVFGPITGYLTPKNTQNNSFWALNAKWFINSKLFCHQWVGPLEIHWMTYLFGPKIAYSSPIWPKNSKNNSFWALEATKIKNQKRYWYRRLQNVFLH